MVFKVISSFNSYYENCTLVFTVSIHVFENSYQFWKRGVQWVSDLKHEVIAERWAALIKERTDSGMTIKEWCQERNIKESQYYYWLKTLRKEETGSGELEQQASPFVELPVVCRGQQAPLQGRTAAIIRKGDISIEVAASASAGFLSKVMEALAYAQWCKAVRPHLPGIWLYGSLFWNWRSGQSRTGQFQPGPFPERHAFPVLRQAHRPHQRDCLGRGTASFSSIRGLSLATLNGQGRSPKSTRSRRSSSVHLAEMQGLAVGRKTRTKEVAPQRICCSFLCKTQNFLFLSKGPAALPKDTRNHMGRGVRAAYPGSFLDFSLAKKRKGPTAIILTSRMAGFRLH